MLTLTPAYGRDYLSRKKIQIDWDNNLDFIVENIAHEFRGKYCNKSSLKQFAPEIKEISIRYNKLQDKFIIEV